MGATADGGPEQEGSLSELRDHEPGLEHVAGDVAVPGWYDATTRMASDAPDSLVGAFGSVGAHTPVEMKATCPRVQAGDSQRRGHWWLRESSHRTLVEADGEYALGIYNPPGGRRDRVGAPARVVGRRARHRVVVLRRLSPGRPRRVRPVKPDARPGGDALNRDAG